MNRCTLCGYVGDDADHLGQCPRCHWDELTPLTEDETILVEYELEMTAARGVAADNVYASMLALGRPDGNFIRDEESYGWVDDKAVPIPGRFYYREAWKAKVL